MSEFELIHTKGGAINASLINSIARIFTVFLDIGRNIGSAINYYINRRSC